MRIVCCCLVWQQKGFQQPLVFFPTKSDYSCTFFFGVECGVVCGVALQSRDFSVYSSLGFFTCCKEAGEAESDEASVAYKFRFSCPHNITKFNYSV
jgi:hypothetical protein